MTVAELRNVLFHVDNQDISIKELRRILFDVPNQDVNAEDMLRDSIISEGRIG